MFIAVITSIKLYLNLANNINEEISLSKDFYILAVSIFKITHLKECDRGVEPLQFLNDCHGQYIKLIEQSSLLRKNIKKDELTKLEVRNYLESSNSSLSSGSFKNKRFESSIEGSAFNGSSGDNSPKNIILTAATEV